MIRSTVLTLALCLPGAMTFAQADWQWNGSLYGRDDATRAGLWLDAGYDVSSNTLNNATVAQALFQGTITRETTQYLRAEDGNSRTYLYGMGGGNLWYRSALNKTLRWYVGAGARDVVAGELRTGLAQLYLNGNGPYEGRSLTLGPSSMTYHSYQYAGGGLEWRKGAFRMGLVGQLLKSSRYYSVQLMEGELYTAPLGTHISSYMDLRYDATANKQDKLGAWYGTGVQLQTWVAYQPDSSRSMFLFQVNDLGRMFFEGSTRYRLQDSLNFSGLEVSNVLQLDDSLLFNGDLDSLEAFLGLQRTHQGLAVWMPANIRLTYVYRATDQTTVILAAQHHLQYGVLRFEAGLNYRLTPWLSFNPQLGFGGFSGIDIGVNAALNFGDRWMFILKTNQLEALVSPQKSTSQGLFGALRVQL